MLHQNGQRNNGFAYSPIVDAPYAMRPESDDVISYPPCPSDYSPVPAPKPELPGWQDALAPLTHMLRWTDHDGHEHSLTIRANDLDTLLLQLRTVKAFIAAAKARDEKPANCHAGVTVAEPEPEQTDSAYDESEPESDDYCPTHGRAKLRLSKYGGVYCAARLRDGSYCKYKGRKGARS